MHSLYDEATDLPMTGSSGKFTKQLKLYMFHSMFGHRFYFFAETVWLILPKIITMNKIITSILLAFSLIAINKAVAQNCCAKNSDMKLLALRTDFKAAHESPVPFNYVAQKGKMMDFPTTDGKTGKAFYVPADEPTDKVLLIFHEWWGLNDYIKREAESWQGLLGNVNVYAIDLYDGKVGTKPDEASKLMNELDNKHGEAIIKGLLKKIGAGKKIATLGWCMGGSWSFTGTLLSGNDAVGCVMYYGFPEKDNSKVKTLKADVLYNWASQDNFITRPLVDELGKRVQATGHKFTLHAFDAVHAFANPSNPKYNEKAAAEAHEYTLKFLKEKLQ